jgi:DNA-binding transcriptional ArsR family regulator
LGSDGGPVRLQLVDVLRKHASKVCVCELVPLFDLSQSTVSHHLKVLREAGIVGSERPGLLGLLLRIRLISHRSFGFHSADPIIALVYLCCTRITINLPR